jgi:hypothetical protein
VPIAPEGVIALVAAGWLGRRQCGDPAAVAAAVIELADAALDLGVRPPITEGLGDHRIVRKVCSS